MHITEYELYDVPPRWQFVKLTTSDGRVGWGETHTKWQHTNDGEPATTNVVDRLFEQSLRGANPSRIEALWQAMYRGSFHRGGPVQMSAISGLDQALWDLKGKRYGAPIYDLLGGAARDRVKFCQRVRTRRADADDDIEASVEDALAQVERGFDALKMNPALVLDRIDTPEKVQFSADLVGAVREAIGPDIGLALDVQGRTTKAMARNLAHAVEPHDPMFIEEPVTPEHNDALGRIARSTTVPIATGERLYTRWDFKPILEADAVDVVQPALSSAGGITEGKKIADVAETYDASFAPHCLTGPLAFMASLHIGVAAPNTLVQEQSFFRKKHGQDYVQNDGVFDLVDGSIEAPDGPGLGLEIDEDVIEQWEGRDLEYTREPVRRSDGSVGET